jgi:hypothetical protein
MEQTMQKKSHRIFWVIIFACILIPIRIDVQAQGDDSPLIYYYSRADTAFVIETAIGAQHEILTNFALRENRQIAGPGWSPSGQWFAWFETSQGAAPSNGYVIHRGSHDYISLFDSEGIIDMYWSPVDDFLLASRTMYDDKANQKTEIVVIDFAADQRILWRDTHTQEQLVSLGWLPYGQGVYIADASGQIYITQIDEGSPANEMTIETSSGFCSPISLSPANYLVHQSADGLSLIVLDVSEGDAKTVIQSKIDGKIRNVYWSHSGFQAVIYTTTSCSENWIGNVWFLDARAGNLLQIAEDAPLLWSLRTTDSRFSYEPIWSPDDTYFAYTTADHTLQIVEPTSLQSGLVDIAQDGGIERFWWVSEKEILFEWNVDQWYQDSIYIVSAASWLDPAEYRVARVDIRYEASAAQFPTLSPRSTKWAFSSPNCNNGCILDLISGKIIESYQIEGLQDVPYNVSEFVWHPSDEWLFLLNSSDGLRYISIVSVSGEIQRQLGLCTLSPSCFGWMPD